MPDDEHLQTQTPYAGFWIRVWASLIDCLLLSVILVPVLTAIYGWEYWKMGGLLPAGPADFLFSWIFPAVAVILFWVSRSATPGKMLVRARIVDAETGEKPSVGQFIGRYLAYYLSILGLFLGYLWVAFDRRKQGWHDKLAGTVVIRRARKDEQPGLFRAASTSGVEV